MFHKDAAAAGADVCARCDNACAARATAFAADDEPRSPMLLQTDRSPPSSADTSTREIVEYRWNRGELREILDLELNAECILERHHEVHVADGIPAGEIALHGRLGNRVRWNVEGRSDNFAQLMERPRLLSIAFVVHWECSRAAVPRFLRRQSVFAARVMADRPVSEMRIHPPEVPLRDLA